MGKLVRDKVTDPQGRIKVLTDMEFKEEVYKKLKEEVNELCEKRDSDKLSEVLEVIKMLYYVDPDAYDDVFGITVRKRKELGSFYGKKYLEEVI